MKSEEMSRQAARKDNTDSNDLQIAQSIGSFADDPADTAFQRGYLAELKVMFIEMQQE